MNVIVDLDDAETREELIESLKKNELRMVFTKLNGEEREIYCTLKEDVISGSGYQYKDNKRKKNSDILVVWDVDADGWRSMRWDSIKEYDNVTETNDAA